MVDTASRGSLVPASATIRINTITSGVIDSKPFPTGTEVTLTHTMSVVAANNNAGTIFISPTVGGNATVCRTTKVGLTAGQSFTFTGLPLCVNGYRAWSFGTGLSYITAAATPNTAICIYSKVQ